MEITETKRSAGRLTLNTAAVGTSGPRILFLHGVTQRWQTFLPLMPAVALRHRVLLVDARGHGQSDRAESYRVVDYIHDICELIRELDEPVLLYGHSLGAMVAIGAAAEMPQQVQAVVMEDPPLHAMGDRIGDTYLLNYFSAVAPFAGTTEEPGVLAQRLATLEFHDPVEDRTLVMGQLRNASQRRFSAACWRCLDPAVFESIVAGQWLDAFDVDSVFSRTACPALLLQADATAGGMLTASDAEHVGSLNPQLMTVRFPGVGHTIHQDATPTLLNTLVSFLESLC